RVESLWGLPEGLYWYSHDTFEVDTGEVDLKISKRISVPSKYTFRERLRYKGTFIASDSRGRWPTFQTSRPFDWANSIRSKAWLFEIAHTTRLIAAKEGHEVSVMWFVDSHPRATPHKVLPWFHTKSEASGS